MTRDLTSGSPLKTILQFAIPVLLGLLLQQVYSLVDTAIVGHALGVMALGGVGATSSVNFLVIGFSGGLCTGMSIPIAQTFGAGDYRALRRYIGNCVWLSAIASALLLALTLPRFLLPDRNGLCRYDCPQGKRETCSETSGYDLFLHIHAP